eukprot:4214163-Amphidinium_carterae.1
MHVSKACWEWLGGFFGSWNSKCRHPPPGIQPSAPLWGWTGENVHQCSGAQEQSITKLQRELQHTGKQEKGQRLSLNYVYGPKGHGYDYCTLNYGCVGFYVWDLIHAIALGFHIPETIYHMMLLARSDKFLGLLSLDRLVLHI